MSANLRQCVGCGALVPDIDGPTHPYIGASPGCWAIYGEVLAREYGEYRYPPVRQLTVDAYAAQHPGTASRRSNQSVSAHLISLYLQLERGYSPKQVIVALHEAATHKGDFQWLDPPASLGSVTVLDVHAAKDLSEHTEVVQQWGRSVWEAWTPHHETVRRWANL